MNSLENDYYELYKIHMEDVGFSRGNMPPSGIHSLRDSLCKHYSWAIPTKENLELIAKYQPLIEMGAGTGYWAYLLRQMNVDIECYDILPHFNTQAEKSWTKVNFGVPKILRWQSYKRNLFLSWPPYDEPFAYNCLKHFRGKYLIYIGEGRGGCTADDDFFKYRNKNFKKIEDSWMPQWFGIHDYLSIWKRI